MYSLLVYDKVLKEEDCDLEANRCWKCRLRVGEERSEFEERGCLLFVKFDLSREVQGREDVEDGDGWLLSFYLKIEEKDE